MEPYRLAVLVDYEGCVLGGGFLLGTLLGREEDVAWRGAGRVRVGFDGGRVEIRARAEGSRLSGPPGRGGRTGARGRLATKGARECGPGGSGRDGPEEPSTRDPRSGSPDSRPLIQVRPRTSRQYRREADTRPAPLHSRGSTWASSRVTSAPSDSLSGQKR